VPGNQVLFNLWRAIMNADHVRYFPASVFATCARPALSMVEAQSADHCRALLNPRHGVVRGVDGFVKNLQCRRFGMHKRQSASNLLWDVTRFQVALDQLSQSDPRSQTAFDTRHSRTSLSALMGRLRAITACHRRTSRATTCIRAFPAVLA
jgi:hypothetical protein